MAKYIVLLGPPGAGKGTQATINAERFGLVHVSSGDLFRDNIKRQTDLGKHVQAILAKGDLVPDDVTIAMVRERLTRPDCQNGALLDGFPRTPAQASALETMLNEIGGKVTLAPIIQVPAETLIERLSGRWTCKLQGHVYHQKYNPPKTAGVCDDDGSELYQRDDDKSETVVNRIKVYQEQTEPLITYYRNAGLLTEIDGTQSIDDVTRALLTAIESAD